MAEKRIWTNEQLSAINATGGELLVTAAAGSGKTSVLTERIVRLITEGGTSVDRLLVLTFSHAAADEMKERISSRISALIAEDPNNMRLFDQQMRLSRAYISTVHSFCASLIRDNFKAAGVSSDFRIIEGAEYDVLQSEVLDEVLEKRYSDKDEGFTALADLLSSDRSDAGLRRLVLDLYGFLVSYDDRDAWIARVRESYSEGSAVKFWREAATSAACEDLPAAIAYAQSALALARSDEVLDRQYAPAIADDIDRYKAMLSAGERADHDALIAASEFEYKPLGRVTNFFDSAKKSNVANLRKAARKIVDDLKSDILCYTDERIRSDTDAMRPIVNALTDVLCDYCDLLLTRKREQNVLAFDDLEHITIELLTEKNEKGERVKTPLATEISQSFDFILVDEYQDTNPAQECIFNALSKNGNLFAVGDAKQAIYAFRNASVKCFTDKKDVFSPYDESDPVFPARIALTANFRSREGVTRLVNYVCGFAFSRTLGGVEYDKSERLVPKGEFCENPTVKPEAEMIFVPRPSLEDSAQSEARLIAVKIRELVENSTLVSDGRNGLRPIEYGDIAVLCRSTRKILQPLKRTLSSLGIPVESKADDLLLEDYSVNVVLSLLQIIDNPYQDVPLAGAMLSPVFSFTPDELSRMRESSRRGSMYEAVTKYAAQGDLKTSNFISIVDSLRQSCALLPVDELILHVCAQTSATALLGAAAKNKNVKSRIDALVSVAEGFVGAGGKGLGAFLRYIERLKKVDGKNALRVPAADFGGGVRVMTVHGSKGLEFPVVFVLCDSRFNTDDLSGKYLVDSFYGFGGSVADGTVSFSTLQRNMIKRKKQSEQRSEELRILYVALTRAVDKLFAVSVFSQSANYFDRFLAMDRSETVKNNVLRSVNFAGDWLVAAALTHKNSDTLCRYAGFPPAFGGDEDDDTRISLIFGEDIDLQFSALDSEVSEAKKNTGEPAELDTSVFSWEYPFIEDTALPTKMSASGVSHGGHIKSAHSVKPAFIGGEETALRGAQAGTAVHLFMSLIDLASDTPLMIQLSLLKESGRINEPQADAVDITACEKLVKSPLGARIVSAAKRGELYREYGFSFRVDAGHIPGFEGANGKILVSGVADLVFFENGKTYIVDYKTDKAKPDELFDRYRGQLSLYRDAATALWKKEVGGTYLWSFYNGCEIDVT